MQRGRGGGAAEQGWICSGARVGSSAEEMGGNGKSYTRLRFQLGDIAGTEEKLAVQIALLNGVHVGDGDAAALAPEPDHRHVLQQLRGSGMVRWRQRHGEMA